MENLKLMEELKFLTDLIDRHKEQENQQNKVKAVLRGPGRPIRTVVLGNATSSRTVVAPSCFRYVKRSPPNKTIPVAFGSSVRSEVVVAPSRTVSHIPSKVVLPAKTASQVVWTAVQSKMEQTTSIAGNSDLQASHSPKVAALNNQQKRHLDKLHSLADELERIESKKRTLVRRKQCKLDHVCLSKTCISETETEVTSSVVPATKYSKPSNAILKRRFKLIRNPSQVNSSPPSKIVSCKNTRYRLVRNTDNLCSSDSPKITTKPRPSSVVIKSRYSLRRKRSLSMSESTTPKSVSNVANRIVKKYKIYRNIVADTSKLTSSSVVNSHAHVCQRKHSNSKLIRIGNATYRATSTKLRRSTSCQSNSRSSRKPSKRRRNEHVVMVRGVPFKGDAKGKTLQRIRTSLRRASISGGGESMRRIDIGVRSFVERIPVTPQRFKTLAAKSYLNRAVQRSIRVLRTGLTSKKLCSFFVRTGRCARHEKCSFRHDPSTVAMCRLFLRNRCEAGENCALSHSPDPRKMPDCAYYLRGRCNRDRDCPYRHVRCNKDAPICLDFAKGFCPSGESCKKKHEWIATKKRTATKRKQETTLLKQEVTSSADIKPETEVKIPRKRRLRLSTQPAYIPLSDGDSTTPVKTPAGKRVPTPKSQPKATPPKPKAAPPKPSFLLRRPSQGT